MGERIRDNSHVSETSRLILNALLFCQAPSHYPKTKAGEWIRTTDLRITNAKQGNMDDMEGDRDT